MPVNRLVFPIDRVQDDMILALDREVAAGRMTREQANQELVAAQGGTYNDVPSNRGQIEGIVGTRANGSQIGRDFSNSLSPEAVARRSGSSGSAGVGGLTPAQQAAQAQWERENYERIRAREEAAAAGLDAEIDADIEQRDWESRAQPYVGNPQSNDGGFSFRDLWPDDWTLGRAVGGGLGTLLPDYVADGIGRGIDNQDGWFRNFFRGGFSGPSPPTGTGGGVDGAPSGSNGPGNQGNSLGGGWSYPATGSPPIFDTGGVNGSGGGSGGGGVANMAGDPHGSGRNRVQQPRFGDPNRGAGLPGSQNPTGTTTGTNMSRSGRRNRAVLTPEQIQLLQSITGNVNQDISGGQGFGLDPLAQGAYDNISRQFGAGSEFGRLGEEAGLKLLRGEQLIPYSDPGREQFYQEAFLNPAMENFRSDILPDIQEAYAGRGLEDGRSGDLLNAELTAGRRLATDLGAQRANLLRGDQERALLGLGQAFNAAAAPQEIAFNTGQQNRFLQNQYSNPAYGIATLALGTQPYATRARSGGSNTNSLIGAGVGAGLGLVGNYLSGGGSNRGSVYNPGY